MTTSFINTDTKMPMTQVPRKKDAVETHLISKKHSQELNRTKENLVLRDVIKFYQEPTNLEQFLAIVQEKSRISLRVLDWFVTRYSKPIEEGGLGICYEIKKVGQRRKIFNVHNSYKAQLKNNHKKLFDPFRRHNRIIFEYGDGCELETTVGQLNFFRWAISNKVLDYVENHLNRITKHMAVYNNTSNSTVQIKAKMSRDKGELVAEVEFH
jgi:hypothetical protein